MLSPDKGLLGTSQPSGKSECLSLFLFQAEVNLCVEGFLVSSRAMVVHCVNLVSFNSEFSQNCVLAYDSFKVLLCSCIRPQTWMEKPTSRYGKL